MRGETGLEGVDRQLAALGEALDTLLTRARNAHTIRSEVQLDEVIALLNLETDLIHRFRYFIRRVACDVLPQGRIDDFAA